MIFCNCHCARRCCPRGLLAGPGRLRGLPARPAGCQAGVGACWRPPLLVAACTAWPAGLPHFPSLACLASPFFPFCLSLSLPLSGYPAPVAPSAAAALCWLLSPCLVGRSFELLCPTAGCCWPRVAAPGRFLSGVAFPPLPPSILQHPPFFSPIFQSQQLSLHQCFCG